VSAESGSPETAATIANTLAELYVRQNLESRLYSSREILKKLPIGMSLDNLSDKSVVESLPSVVSNPLIQQLKADLIKYEAEYADLSKRYKEKHPSMISLRAKILQLQQRIDTEMANTVESVRTELSGDFKANNIRIVDYAEVPRNPIRPRKKLSVMLACLFGFIMGSGFAFFFEYMDNTIKTTDDIEKYLQVPFIGLVPRIRSKSEDERMKYIIQHPKSPPAEALKLIRTNIIFSAAGGSLKTILLTSAAPDAGKTFVSTNLATIFAQLGEKTLLVDTDLRRSALSRALNVQNYSGLSNFLIGEATFDEVVKKSDIEHLNIVASGPHPPNPAELLTQGKMKDFIEEAKRKYDRIIFDTSPVLPVSDTLNFAHIVDGAIQVVRYGRLNRQLEIMANTKLKSVDAKLIGAIINYVNLESSASDAYTYYGYNYHSYSDYYTKE
jgi:capsular exopolysaccharide synthesis family protein